MGERRILLIGSQCDALNPLSFLPKVAEELYGVMTDPKLGGCVFRSRREWPIAGPVHR
jgi:hypothetical protein